MQYDTVEHAEKLAEKVRNAGPEGLKARMGDRVVFVAAKPANAFEITPEVISIQDSQTLKTLMDVGAEIHDQKTTVVLPITKATVTYDTMVHGLLVPRKLEIPD